MTTEQVIKYALSLPGAQQKETKNGRWTVFTKGETVFLLIRKDDPVFNYISILLPESKGLELQDEYNIVSPAIIGIKDWIDIDIDNNFPAEKIESWIKESYNIATNTDNDKYVTISKMLGL